MSEQPRTVEAIAAEMVALVGVRPDGAGWVGDAPPWFGDRLFGGFVVAQALAAAGHTAPDGWRVHSLHGYFLRPVLAAKPLQYQVTSLRDGRAFAVRRLETVQDGGPVFAMTCSFTCDGPGPEYELAVAGDVPDPEELTIAIGPGPWQSAALGPAPAEADGTRRSTQRTWFRVPVPLPDDPHLHAVLLTFLTDVTNSASRPLDLEGDLSGIISLDHAVWYHRPARVDGWLFYDLHSLVNSSGRSLIRGTIHDRERRLVASMAQEVVLRP